MQIMILLGLLIDYCYITVVYYLCIFTIISIRYSQPADIHSSPAAAALLLEPIPLFTIKYFNQSTSCFAESDGDPGTTAARCIVDIKDVVPSRVSRSLPRLVVHLQRDLEMSFEGAEQECKVSVALTTASGRSPVSTPKSEGGSEHIRDTHSPNRN